LGAKARGMTVADHAGADDTDSASRSTEELFALTSS
jgi:hypothetical protein